MAETGLTIGLTLSNRGVVLGYIDAAGLIDLAAEADASGRFDSVWAGDSFLATPRLDAITLLAAIASRTRRVLLAPGCMGSFTQREVLGLAYEWASLDRIAGGRTAMVACSGGGSPPEREAEGRVTEVPVGQRRPLMWERIALLRRLWSEDDVTFEGRFHRCRGITISPKPVRVPYPIWVAFDVVPLMAPVPELSLPMKSLARVGAECDGWMTHSVSPAEFARAWTAITDGAKAAGKDAGAIDNCLYQNICIAGDARSALAEGIDFLNEYYGARFTEARAKPWLFHGTPAECAAQLRAFAGSGVKRISLRLASRDQERQLRRLTEEVLPMV